MIRPFFSGSSELADLPFRLGEPNLNDEPTEMRIFALKLNSHKSKPIKSVKKPGSRSSNPANNLKNSDAILWAGFALRIKVSFNRSIIFPEVSLRIRGAMKVVDIARIKEFSEPIEDATSKKITTSMISKGTKSPRIFFTCVPKFSNG